MLCHLRTHPLHAVTAANVHDQKCISMTLWELHQRTAAPNVHRSLSFRQQSLHAEHEQLPAAQQRPTHLSPPTNMSLAVTSAVGAVRRKITSASARFDASAAAAGQSSLQLLTGESQGAGHESGGSAQMMTSETSV